MSGISRDPKRHVSDATETDFARAIAGTVGGNIRRGSTSLVVSLAANYLWSKSKQRGKR